MYKTRPYETNFILLKYVSFYTACLFLNFELRLHLFRMYLHLLFAPVSPDSRPPRNLVNTVSVGDKDSGVGSVVPSYTLSERLTASYVPRGSPPPNSRFMTEMRKKTGRNTETKYINRSTGGKNKRH